MHEASQPFMPFWHALMPSGLGNDISFVGFLHQGYLNRIDLKFTFTTAYGPGPFMFHCDDLTVPIWIFSFISARVSLKDYSKLNEPWRDKAMTSLSALEICSSHILCCRQSEYGISKLQRDSGNVTWSRLSTIKPEKESHCLKKLIENRP